MSTLLKPGDSGDKVTELHKLLTKKGLLTLTTSEIEKNIFGPITESVIKQFQVEHGLAVDGLVGPQTFRALGRDDDTLDGFFVPPDFANIKSNLPSKMLELADKAFRGGVKEVPYGSNRGPLVSPEFGGVDAYLTWNGNKSYLEYEKVEPELGYPNNMKGAPWCAAFAAWLLDHCCKLLNVKSPLLGINDLMSDSKWLRAAKRANKLMTTAQPGQVALLGTSPTNLLHTVLIASVIDQKIYTREGNSRGQRVAALVREVHEVQYFIDLTP